MNRIYRFHLKVLYFAPLIIAVLWAMLGKHEYTSCDNEVCMTKSWKVKILSNSIDWGFARYEDIGEFLDAKHRGISWFGKQRKIGFIQVESKETMHVLKPFY